MADARLAPLAYPFNDPQGLTLHERYRDALAHPRLTRVRLPYGEPAWLATRFADVRAVLGDPRFSREEAARHDAPRTQPVQPPPGILSSDPPHHTRIRNLIAKAFTPRRVEEMRPAIRARAEELVGAMLAMGPPVDLVEHYALALPVSVICELLGVPLEDRPRFRQWSDDALSTNRLSKEEFEASRTGLQSYMTELYDKRRAAPRDDLVSALIAVRVDDDRLSEEELLDLGVSLLVAGHETTASQISNFLYVLIEEPEQWERLRADPGLIPAAVEELLRYVSTGSGGGRVRYATEDVEVGGTRVRAGEPVLVAFGAANRDAERFEDPDALVLDRNDRHHVGFGHGVHHCLGAALARVELQETLRVMLDRMPGLRLAGDITWKTKMLVRGPRVMPIGW
ncbi:cytochrome P450 [Streptomyces daliensis]